ncbi:MAG TPA: DUF4097 family beta strand repeat-containing protein [Bryobacteraceae bacterium]|jgi:DUF4097 and DUF4098 domain-containing protein YvlB
MRQRGSIVGPLILITIGILFLARTAWPAFSVIEFISVYWPYLLILWGGLQIVEISIRAIRHAPMPNNGISGGGWFLVLLIAIFGFVAFEVHGPNAWWRRAGFDQGMDWFGEAHDFTVPQQTHKAGKRSIIRIENFRGSAKISGTATDEVTLTGHKIIRAMHNSEARQSDSETPVEIRDEGDTIVIAMNQQKARNKVRVTTNIDLTVPRDATIEATGRAGDFDVSGIDGDVRISSDNAGVRLQDIGGNVVVDTNHGDLVRCANVRGSVVLKGHSSDVELDKIAGQVTIDGSYSGTLTFRQIDRPLHLDNFGTTVSVQKINGELTMDRGSFSAQGIIGPSQVRTHATDVEVAGFTNALEVSVDKGDVSLRPAPGTLSPMSVHTSSGNIDLALPGTAAFELTASTDRGDIENEFGSSLKLESAGKGARLVGAVGSGPALNLTTDRGTIAIRKGSATLQESNSQMDSEPSPPRSPKPVGPPKPPAPQKSLGNLKLSTASL